MEIKPAICPNCKTAFTDKESFFQHMTAHGFDIWKIKQLWAERNYRLQTPHFRERKDHICKCPFYKTAPLCEFRARWTY